MTEPTRYDAVDDRLVECVNGKVVKYKDWLATENALRAKLDVLRLAPNDMLLVRVPADYEHAQVAGMAQALQSCTDSRVVVISVDIEMSPLSPDLTEAELRELAQHFEEDGTHDVTVGAFKAIVRRVMRMRMGG